MRTDRTPVETRPTTRPKLTAERSLDPTAAIAAHSTMVDFRPVASAAAEEIAVLRPRASRFERFSSRRSAEVRSVTKLSRSTSWTCRRRYDRDLPSMSAGGGLTAPVERVFAANFHLAASAACQNGAGKTPSTKRAVKSLCRSATRTCRRDDERSLPRKSAGRLRRGAGRC
jgi:hypothetical protein